MIKTILRLNEWLLCTPSHIFVGSALGKFVNPFFLFFLFALDHTEYCVNQCIVYLACIGIGMLFLCLQHVRRVWGQRLKNVEFSKDTWMVHCISLKKMCLYEKGIALQNLKRLTPQRFFFRNSDKELGNKCFCVYFSSLSPKAKFQILLFDKCPTLTSSISSTPVSFHCGISDAHICETFLSLEKKKNCLGSQRFSNSKHRPMSPQTWTDGVHRAATSCDSLRGDELALGDIPQLSSVMDQHKVPRFSYMEALAWTLSHWFASVGEAGFDVGRVRVGTLRISAVTRLGHTEWLPLSAGKKTHILITTGSLVMALFECIPTCEWGSETGRREVRNISLRGLLAGRQSEWASCRSTITNRPAAWEGLPNIIHMCHILSEPPPGLAVHSRREGGVLVRAHFTQARGQLGSALAVKWPLRRGRL